VKGEQIGRRWHGAKLERDSMETVGIGAQNVRGASLLSTRRLVFRSLWLKGFLYSHLL
jgi:hypothetical protein